MTDAPAQGTGTWVVLPTYDEAENLPGIAAAILEILPAATLLVVDDSSPDGTGELAEQLSAGQPRIKVRHRPARRASAAPTSTAFGSRSTAAPPR